MQTAQFATRAFRLRYDKRDTHYCVPLLRHLGHRRDKSTRHTMQAALELALFCASIFERSSAELRTLFVNCLQSSARSSERLPSDPSGRTTVM